MADLFGAMVRARGPLGGLAVALLLAACQGLAVPSGALAAGERTVSFRGHEVRVPAGWPVYRLDRHPSTCVRLDRRAVYLGAPSPNQRCPASAMGRRRAILIDPGARRRAARARRSRAPLAHVSAASNFTGLGFDACTAPSKRTMSAWGSSPYRAIGVYIGGLNRACSQPNLTPNWVAEQVAAGWHLIPTYVGLQAPTSSCGSCATLSSGSASSQGAAAAADAVGDASAAGIGPGSPIYFDMEAYTRTASSSRATLAFLAAWTARLHALGYTSGVYSSGASGIADLVDRLGSGYLQPDDIWVANWNGRKTASDPYVPAGAWSDHQRIHQYRGGHDETYGGVTINIDNNFVEGATAGTALAGDDDPKGSLDLASSPQPGQLRVAGWAFDPNAPRKPLAIRVYVGGKAERGQALGYELGPIAALQRPDIAFNHRAAGAAHGFDVSFATTKSGRQPVCAYAVDIGLGADRELGCRRVGIAVPIGLSRVRAAGNAIRVRVTCQWPAGVQCPGRILLRAHVRMRRVVRHRGRRVARTRLVRTRIGSRTFRLTGGRSHAFSVRLGRRGRRLTRDRSKLRAQLLVAIPGGRKGRGLTLRRGRGLPR